ncbi:hypothetical protein I3842_08G136500 [Carya illinoinensis]|uniref:Oxidoreductase-like domain-containing protein n=1 Tax=Carya illinoinensis TaxID=32201 RepID=A0A922ECX5_CARIL|nr:hypothetical protein I3842_08G136500 [Carya illinoinensis]
MELAAHWTDVPCTSPAPSHRLQKPEHVPRVRARVGLPMSLGTSLTLGRVSANTIAVFNHRLQDPPRFFCPNVHRDYMADKTKIEAQAKLESIGKDKELEEKLKTKEEKWTSPPPPEKPLPGDCCGSGCVRCVWDVYYEELEAYDKLCKSDSESKSTPS